MATLITRRELVNTKRIIGSEITKLQKACYDADLLQEYIDDHEEQLYWEMFDCVKDETTSYETNHTIIGLDYPDINTFTTVLSNKLNELFETIEVNELYILSDLKRDFFGNRDNQFKPLANAYKKLEKITCQTSYKEAFIFNRNELKDLIDILFWLTRCDPSVPEYIFFFDGNQKIELCLCKYGNIHLTEIGSQYLTKKRLISLGWQVIEGKEVDNFSDGRIEGRQIKL